MIVYLASYPRSGNSWLQLLIYTQFRKLVSSVYDIGDYPPPHIQDWEITTQATPPSPETITSEWRSHIPHLLWDQSIALYQDPELKTQYPNHFNRFLWPGCLNFLTPVNREKLAAETEVFFIKTHELPYEEYFPGEIVIQPIRNPGAVIWSYYQLINATKLPTEPVTSISDIILGRVKYGSWSDYHHKWLEAKEKLQNNYLSIYFESLTENEDQFCVKIAEITGVKYLKRKFLRFPEIQPQNPTSKREGKAFGWEKNLTLRELKLIYVTHGEMMDKLSYGQPNYQVANKEREKMDQQLELKLQVLHDLLYEAVKFPNCATAYTTFVRSLRERLHPIGVKDIQTANLASGLKLQVDLGDRLGADIYYGYYQEYFDSQLILSLVNVGATVLDIGANSGYYTILTASKIGDEGLVLSFEPHPDAYELLQKNALINNLDNLIQSYQICLGEEDGETEFYLTEESSFSGISATGRAKIKEKVKLPIYRLDTFLAKLNIPTVDIIKIDVEGYEFAVLEGAKTTLKNSPDCLIMLEVSSKNLNQTRQEKLIKVLADIYELGFRGWLVESQSETLKCLESPDDIKPIGATNLFVTHLNSPTTENLQTSYRQLRRQAFQGIATQLHLTSDNITFRNSQDPLGYVQLSGALIDSCLRNQTAQLSAEIVKLKNEVNRLEIESKSRLAEIYKRDSQIQAELNLSLGEQILKKIKGKFFKK